MSTSRGYLSETYPPSTSLRLWHCQPGPKAKRGLLSLRDVDLVLNFNGIFTPRNYELTISHHFNKWHMSYYCSTYIIILHIDSTTCLVIFNFSFHVFYETTVMHCSKKTITYNGNVDSKKSNNIFNITLICFGLQCIGTL